jgi:hypothetical protein
MRWARARRASGASKAPTKAVSVRGLRSFMAVLGDDDVGLFVCRWLHCRAAEAGAHAGEAAHHLDQPGSCSTCGTSTATS